jgi:hypothetical protein
MQLMPSEEESLAPPDPSVFLAPPDSPPAPDQSAEIVALMAENSALKKDLMECEEDWAAQAKVSQQKSYSLHFALLQVEKLRSNPRGIQMLPSREESLELVAKEAAVKVAREHQRQECVERKLRRDLLAKEDLEKESERRTKLAEVRRAADQTRNRQKSPREIAQIHADYAAAAAYAQVVGRALTCSVFLEWKRHSQGKSLAVPSAHLAKSTLPA